MVDVDVLWRAVNRAVAAPNKTAAFPTQEVIDTGNSRTYGVIVLRPGKSDFQDVPRNDLADLSTGGARPDFRTPGVLLRQIDKWAYARGYAAGSADFEQANVGSPPATVFGAFLYPFQNGLVSTDIPRSELPGSPSNVVDVPTHMVALTEWARSHGYVGGLPNWQEATYSSPPGQVWGAHLFSNDIAFYEQYSEDQLGLPHPSGTLNASLMADSQLNEWSGMPVPQPPPTGATVTRIEIVDGPPVTLTNVSLKPPGSIDFIPLVQGSGGGMDDVSTRRTPLASR